MKLPLLGQLAQLMLGLGLGAALGLAFDVLRVPRRHARSAVFRALLDGTFCLLALGSVFLLGMTAGDGQVRLFLFAAIAGGWTCYFLWLSGHIFPQLERSGRLCARKMRQITAPGRKFIKKVLFLIEKGKRVLWIFLKNRILKMDKIFPDIGMNIYKFITLLAEQLN